VDLYWTIKTVLGKVLLEQHEAYNKVLLQLDGIHLQINEVNQKVEMLAQRMAGLDSNAQQDANQEELQAPSDAMVTSPT
jgi:hypothetical protein